MEPEPPTATVTAVLPARSEEAASKVATTLREVAEESSSPTEVTPTLEESTKVRVIPRSWSAMETATGSTCQPLKAPVTPTVSTSSAAASSVAKRSKRAVPVVEPAAIVTWKGAEAGVAVKSAAVAV